MILGVTIDPVVGVVLAAVVAALGGFLAQAWRMSGKIGTSEAETLWAQSSRMYDAQAKRLEALEARVQLLESDKTGLQEENLALRERNLTCEREVARLTERADRTAEENARLRSTIQRLGGFDGGT